MFSGSDRVLIGVENMTSWLKIGSIVGILAPRIWGWEMINAAAPKQIILTALCNTKCSLKRHSKDNGNNTCMPSSTVPPVLITILTWNLFGFARFWKVGGRTSRGENRDHYRRFCESASWINCSSLTPFVLTGTGTIQKPEWSLE